MMSADTTLALLEQLIRDL